MSFKLNDYKLIKTMRDLDGNRIGEYYISKKDTSLTLIRSFWPNGKIKFDAFSLNKKKIGPFRVYYMDGKQMFYQFYFGDFDSTIYKYDSVRLALIKR